ILVRDADSLYLVSSAPTAALRADALMRCRARFRDYMGRRGLGSLTLLPDTVDDSDFIRRRDNMLAIGATRFAILNGDRSPESSWRVDYLIVARGFKGDIIAAYGEFAPDSAIILSSSLNLRRRERYVSELDSAHITPLIY
ncbi:MAG: hypothetical protein K2M97_04200, partial [Muribaculaceae bacterium]|nr:hypothetical protein [Muribaculaceae bacterium]